MIAELVREMGNAGAPTRAIAIAVEAIEALQQAEKDRRGKRAAQKRRERAGGDGAGVSRDKAEPVAATDPSPKERSPTPPKEITPSRASLRSDSSGEREFEVFWATVPYKIGRDTARKIYLDILRAGRATPQDILAGAIRWREASCSTEPKFVPHPATWLKRGGWKDETKPPGCVGRLVGRPPRSNDGITNILNKIYEARNASASSNHLEPRWTGSSDPGTSPPDRQIDEQPES